MNSSAVHPPLAPHEVREALAARTVEVEERVGAAFHKALAGKYPKLAIVAVGGFGRRQMFPHSDVDLMLLAAGDSDIPEKADIAVFLQDIWDARMRPSHSVHTIAECAAEQSDNLEFTISLLDHRFLLGSEIVHNEMMEKFDIFRGRRGTSLARKLALLADERRAKYQHTIFHLEPNIKETPGGFRDIQTAQWLHAFDPHGPAPELTEAFTFLAGIRWRLHEAGGRDQNQLTFDAQDALSEDPGALMRDYYRHAREVTRAARKAIERCTEKRSSLIGTFHAMRSRLSTADFTVSRERVLLRGSQPPEGFKLFEFTARHGLRLAQDTIDRLQRFTPTASWNDWKQLLSLPQAGAGLRALQLSGVLARLLPEWEPIECLVVRDFYHRYTVDEHTLVAASKLDKLPDDRFNGIALGEDGLALVRFALLMHDIGKAAAGRQEHIEASMQVAEQVLKRFAAPEDEIASVLFLIEHQDVLAEVITQRDLKDAQLVADLAHRIGSRERLGQLTLLTYADIAAVNPDSLTPFHLEQLWSAYDTIREELTRELASEKIADFEGMAPERAAFLKGLPMRYLRTHTTAEIDTHFALALQLQQQPLALELKHKRGLYELVLLTKDRPALFAAVSGALASFGLNIMKAEAFANAQGVVVDTFTFTDPTRTLELNPSEIDRLRTTVKRVVEGKQDPRKLLRGRPKRSVPGRAQLQTKVEFKDEASSEHTLIEIVTEDRPGLLNDVGNTLTDFGCDIEVVLIDTAAHKAMDVFYVNRAGAKLDALQQDQLRGLLLKACSGST